jgi:ATP-binding cassette subfamily B (MDR/TAP) protein 6
LTFPKHLLFTIAPTFIDIAVALVVFCIKFEWALALVVFVVMFAYGKLPALLSFIPML